MNDEPIPNELLDRYLAGETHPEEAEQVARWLQATPGATELPALVQALPFPQPDPHVSDAQIERHWNTLVAQLDTPAPRASRRSIRPSWLAPGAAMLAVAALVVAITIPGPRNHPASMTNSVVQQYATQVAQYATVKLPDGSQAQLAPLTTVRYLESSSGERTIDLEGQAFFTVTHDAEHPVTIRTGSVNTRVLGTAFDVQRYSHDAVVRVSVVEGKVSAGGQRTVIVTPGETAELTDSVASVRKDANAINRWWSGELTFTDTPVPEMLASLGRWYGYDFQLADSTLVKQYVTATFLVGKSDETLATLRAMLSVEITRTGNRVVLTPRRTSGGTANKQMHRWPLIDTQTRAGK